MNEHKQKVLVVEDEEDLRNVITTILSDESYEVILAENGFQGLELAKAIIPDLILCDIQMPSMNGYDLLNAVKMEPELGKIPFVFMTGVNTRHFEMRKGMELGADDYLTKPFSTEELLSAVQTRLRKKQSWQKFFDTKVEKIHTGLILLLSNELHMLVMDILEQSQFLLKDKEIPVDMVQRAAQMINNSGKRLSHLHENILLYAMLQLWVGDKEKIASLRKEKTASYVTILNAVIDENIRAHERKHSIEVNCEDVSLQISPAYFGKVIDEIIDNACKFSEPNSSITISSAVNEGNLMIAIRDEGRGMTEEEIENIESLMQNDHPVYKQKDTGLGLTIAKTIVEIHGGTISIESTEKKGTTVVMTFLKAKEE